MRGLKPDNNRIMSIDLGVASFTDAWIETTTIKKSKWKRKSHLLQMRGLKHVTYDKRNKEAQSHLLQMRGLKPRSSMDSGRQNQVASFTDAWIETGISL